MATRRILGTVSLSSSSCLATHSRPAVPDTPVTLPPGRARLAMSPVPTGSQTAIITLGDCTDGVPLGQAQLGRQVGQPVDPILRISIVDDNILALNPPELAQPLPERVEQGRPIGRGREAKKTYPRPLARLLRVGGERRREDTESKNDESDQPHAAEECSGRPPDAPAPRPRAPCRVRAC